MNGKLSQAATSPDSFHTPEDDDTALSLPAVSMQVLRGLPSPWQAILFRVDAFPQSLAEGAPVAFFLEALLQRIVSAHPALHQQVLLQFWKLSAETGSDVLAEHATDWDPEYGLGMWPGRRPPQRWNDTMAMDAAAAIFRGDEPELPAYRLLRLKAEQAELAEAVEEFRGLGVLLQSFSLKAPEALDGDLNNRYLPEITDPGFRRADFVFPLLDCRILASARSAEQINQWLCGIDLYIRESPEDKGILLLSRIPLDPS